MEEKGEEIVVNQLSQILEKLQEGKHFISESSEPQIMPGI